MSETNWDEPDRQNAMLTKTQRQALLNGDWSKKTAQRIRKRIEQTIYDFALLISSDFSAVDAIMATSPSQEDLWDGKSDKGDVRDRLEDRIRNTTGDPRDEEILLGLMGMRVFTHHAGNFPYFEESDDQPSFYEYNKDLPGFDCYDNENTQRLSYYLLVFDAIERDLDPERPDSGITGAMKAMRRKHNQDESDT